MKYHTRKNALILLEDGTVFFGKAVGDQEGSAYGGICFNTGMSGYQELMTDPSGHGQIMVTTTAHTGGYGVNKAEMESDRIHLAGLVVRNFGFHNSRIASDGSLEEFMNENNLLAISDVDTRALTQHILSKGAMNAVISTETDNVAELKNQLSKLNPADQEERVSKVSTSQPYYFGTEDAKHRVAVLDLGVKKSFLTRLAEHDCYIRVFPYNATLEAMEAFEPNGYFISNGPGNPNQLKETLSTVAAIVASGKPVFGVCLGHQVIGLSQGITVDKMKNGHRGLNHPVKNLRTGKGEITSQNNGFVLNKEAVEANADVAITHINLNDESVAGIRLKDKPVFSVQFHPGARPGPEDSLYLYDEFFALFDK